MSPIRVGDLWVSEKGTVNKVVSVRCPSCGLETAACRVTIGDPDASGIAHATTTCYRCHAPVQVRGAAVDAETARRVLAQMRTPEE